uniref:Putative secreted protein n=1 Tax=Ixodes ricinus TaxID=34613 RepID=A0A6B0UHA8_IXORI
MSALFVLSAPPLLAANHHPNLVHGSVAKQPVATSAVSPSEHFVWRAKSAWEPWVDWEQLSRSALGKAVVESFLLLEHLSFHLFPLGSNCACYATHAVVSRAHF